MEMIKAKYEFFLTHTFRCSASVVEEANKVLKNYLGAKNLLCSKRKAEAFEINNVAFIARTNATLIELMDVPAFWIGTDISEYNGLRSWGLGKGSISYDYPSAAFVSIEITGLIK